MSRKFWRHFGQILLPAAIVLWIGIVLLVHWLTAEPDPIRLEIGEPLVISKVEPISVEHPLPRPVLAAISLIRFRDQLPDLIWPAMRVEMILLEESRPAAPSHAPLRYRPANPIPPDEIETLLAGSFLEEDLSWARRVSFCESGWDAGAKNRNSTAAGLFQFLRSTWDWVAGQVDFPSYDSGAVYDPALNVRAAAWLYYNEGPHHWVCQ